MRKEYIVYTLTFNEKTLQDLREHDSHASASEQGRQFFCAVVIPDSGVFTNKKSGSDVHVPDLVCPYQINDIIAIKEQWAYSDYSGYVYKTDGDLGYDYRPASTLPNSAVRMYGRITSINTWSVTQQIADNYLSIGLSADSYPGVGEVIGCYKKGDKYLKSLRDSKNKEILSKLNQPPVPKNLPTVLRYVPYKLRYPVEYILRYTSYRSGVAATYTFSSGQSTHSALAYDRYFDPGDGSYRYEIWNGSDAPISVSTIATDLSAWTYFVANYREYEEYAQEFKNKYGRNLVTINRGKWNEDRTRDVYLILQDQGGINPIPVYACYVTETTDPDQHLFAWLITGYLSDSEGNILGKYF